MNRGGGGGIAIKAALNHSLLLVRLFALNFSRKRFHLSAGRKWLVEVSRLE